MADHPDEDLLLALALDDLDERERDELVRHIASCDRCRSEYTAIADSVDHVLAAAPRVAPPPGFSHSVLAAMGLAAPDDGAPESPSGPNSPAASTSLDDDRRAGIEVPPQVQRGRRGLALALFATVALLAGAVGAVAVLENRREPAAAVIAATGPALTTRDGTRVGTVLASRFEDGPVLIVTLTDGRVGVRYDCELVLADGTRESAGSWLVEDPAATWVVGRSAGSAEVRAVELVAPSGAVWATAEL